MTFSTRPRIDEDKVLQALRTVMDPERHRDIVSLGMVSGLAVRDNNVQLAIEVAPERGTAAEPIRAAAEAAVRRLKGIVSVTAVLTAQKKPTVTAAPPGPTARVPRPGLPTVSAIIAVASGKGGVGKSTTAVNLALGLRANGRTVGLLDADIYGPSAPKLLGITGKPTTNDGKTLEPKEAYSLKVMSMGFLVPEDTPMIWRGPMVQSALQQMLREVNWGVLDVLVVDMPPGTGDAQLTLAQQVPLAGAVIVSTPQDLALLDARKGLNMFRKVDVPVLGIVENMSTYICPNCGHRADIFGHGGARREAEQLGMEFLGGVPLDLEIRVTSDAGTPIVATQPDGPHAKLYRYVAERVWDQVRPDAPQTARRPPPRIVVVN